MDYHEHEYDIMDSIKLNNTKYQLFKKSLIGKILKNKVPIQRSTRIKNITVLLHQTTQYDKNKLISLTLLKS